MKAVIQRVLSASVTVDGTEISKIGRGLMCLIGLATTDTPTDVEYIVKKILSLKLFPEATDVTLSKQWAKSVIDIQGEVLCVSQFTLHATTRKGSKPDFHNAMGTQQSQTMYSDFLQQMRKAYHEDRIQDGRFGAMMQVSLTNEGPVTIIIDSNDGRSARGTSSTSVTPVQSTSSDSTQKQADREAYLQEKLRKREEHERRQLYNAARKAALKKSEEHAELPSS